MVFARRSNKTKKCKKNKINLILPPIKCNFAFAKNVGYVMSIKQKE